MENQDPWAQFPDAPAVTAPAQDDPWASFPDVTTDSVPLINAAHGRTDDGRDATGVPSGLSSADVSPQGTPATFAPDPVQDIQTPGTPEVDPNAGWSETLRTGVNLASGVTPAMKEQMDKAGVTPVGDYVADAVGGVINAPRNTVEAALSLGDENAAAQEAATGSSPLVPDDTVGMFNAVVPRYVPEGGSSLATTGAELVTGGLGAKKGAEAVAKTLPKGTQWFAKLLGEAVGGTAAVSPNAEGGLVGEGSYTGYSPADKVGVTNETLKQKMDLTADALITAAPIAGVAGLGMKGMAVVKDLTFDRFVNFFSKGAQRDQVAKSIMSELGSITPDMTDDQITAHFDNVIATITKPENKNLYDALVAKITPEELAKLTPEQRALLDIKRDTISAFEAGHPTGSAETAGGRSLREGVLRQGAPDVQEAMATPVKAADDYNEFLNESAGGRAAADETAKVVQQSGRDQVAAAKGVADDTVRAFNDEAADVSKIISEDDIYGGRVNDIGTNVNINTSGPRDQVRTRIGRNIERGFDADTAELNSLAARARESGAALDEAGLNDAGNEVLAQNLLSKNDATILKNFVDGESNDYGEIFSLTPTLTKRIDELTRNGQSNLAQPLMDLRDVINNPVGDGEAVQAFRDYYKNDYIRKYGDGIGKDLANVQKQTTTMQRDGTKLIKKEHDKEVGLDEVVDRALTKTPYTEQLHKLLSNPAAGNSTKDISNLIVADSLESIQKTVNRTGKFTPKDFDGVVSALEENGARLTKVDPEQASKLNALATRVRDRKISLQEIGKEVDTIVKGAEQAKKNIYGRELATFFKVDEMSGKYNRVSNGYNALSSLMNDTKAVVDDAGKTKLDRVIDRVNASDNEIAKKGLQSAWANEFRDKFFSVAEDATGTTKVKSKFVSDANLGKNELLATGEKVFKDNPGVMLTMKTLAEEADRISGARSATSHMIQEGKTAAQQGQSAFQMVTTFLFGPLSRTGSKVRSAGSKLLAKSDPEVYMNDVLQKVLADPDEFEIIAKQFMKNNKKAVPIEAKKELIRWAVNTKIKTPEEAETSAMQMDAQKDDDTKLVFPE